MPKQAAGLGYAVRLPVLAKYFGQLCLVVAALTIVPLAVSLIHGETPIAFKYVIVIVAMAAAITSTGLISMPQMARAGFIFNILTIFIITGMMYLHLGHAFNVLWGN